ncbi:MAG TPA: metalloregulator ArsR/SmtB family transcription factor [Candidatus Dormibacteraeota bacterium]|nr:metalloregulator ArsR/SmtB family transcription factor [Candidatus Dormibacteraeota bacterium]
MPRMQVRTRNHPLEAAMEAIASPRRRQILRLVWGAERSAGEIASTVRDVSWPAVSQNLRVLKNSGLITERRQGTHRYYKADRQALGPLEVVLRQMWARDLGRLRQLAEEEAGKKRHD